MKLEHPLIGMVIQKCVFLNIAKKYIVFCWVPSHTGIKGNEKADSAAKSALDLSRTKVGVPYNDFKHCINQYIFSTWQDDWNGAVMNKLHSVSGFMHKRNSFVVKPTFKFNIWYGHHAIWMHTLLICID